MNREGARMGLPVAKPSHCSSTLWDVHHTDQDRQKSQETSTGWALLGLLLPLGPHDIPPVKI